MNFVVSTPSSPSKANANDPSPSWPEPTAIAMKRYPVPFELLLPMPAWLPCSGIPPCAMNLFFSAVARLNIPVFSVATLSASPRWSANLYSHQIRKNSPDGSLHPDGLTKKFVAARKASGLSFEESPPTFHEIRSLAGRLYEKERGKDFAQKLLGHSSETMTLKYLNTRGKEYVML